MVKIKRRRKPMTPEQKAAAIERLAKAREREREKGNNTKTFVQRFLQDQMTIHYV